MDQVKPPDQNGLLGSEVSEHLMPTLTLINKNTTDDVTVTKEKLVDGSPVPETVDDGAPSEPPARGLELIYKVAEELATRIADEKRYEGIIKPCSVSILKISDTSQYKIIRDGDMILDENITNDTSISKKQLKTDEEFNGLYEDMQIECNDSSDEEEEMILPSNNENNSESEEEKASFFCIFCHEKNLQGKSNATDHYQSHLDYYPYKCTQCLEVTTNLKNLFIHYRKDHSKEKTVTFKKKLSPWVSEWIDGFLRSQKLSNYRKNAQPRAYCPVCESSEKKEDIIQIPPNLIQPRKHLMHVFKHLNYEPYACGICQKAGKKFTINDFDDRAYEHIMKNHPEAEDTLLAKVFQKSRFIKPLEGYVLHYVSSAGVSTKRRVPEKIPNFARNKYKAKQENKEKERTNTDKDTNRPTTLEDLLNQSSSTSLLNDQSGASLPIIGQKTDIPTNLSNQTKVNLNINSTPHQINKTPPTINKPVKMLANPNSLLLSPSKGPSPQFTTLAVNNLPLNNCYTVTSISILPNHNINGISTPQPLLLPNQPEVIQLPCGQLMIRNNNNRVPASQQILPQPKLTNQQPTGAVSLLRSPPSILRRPSIPSSPEKPMQNGSVEVQVSPDLGSFIESGIPNKHKLTDEFVKKNYFCMFCKEMVYFESFTEGLFHFSKHLNYKPVNCLLCGGKFGDLGSTMKHFVESHPHRTFCQDDNECAPLLYYINRDGQLEKWIEQFLYFQITGELHRLTSVDCANYCVVCKSIQKNTRIPNRTSNKNSDVKITPPVEVVRIHINLHCSYTPYECFLCSKAGNQVKFAAIGDTALRHLKSHGFSPIDGNFLKEFFHFKPIFQLENFIKNYLITEFYPYANTNGYGHGNALQQQINFTLNGINNHNYLKCSSDNVSKRLFSENSENSDESISPSSSSQNCDRKRFARMSYACYHCKIAISGTRELLNHCKTIHPNLSVASYCLPTING